MKEGISVLLFDGQGHLSMYVNCVCAPPGPRSTPLIRSRSRRIESRPEAQAIPRIYARTYGMYG